MVQMRYTGEKNLIIMHQGKTRVIRPGQIVNVPKRVLKRMSLKRRGLFEKVDNTEARIRRLERAVKYLAKEIENLKGRIP